MTVVFGSVLALDASMIVVDERLPIFPFVFGLDVRYVLTLVIPLFTGVTIAISRLARRFSR
ncbi:MAG TPA: hypothetical protein VGS11_01035 [Candidatus Bathyarchaeia archaeon]|nr:hypothetical protein [Candidatus Bathyarchaeia archaeon]